MPIENTYDEAALLAMLAQDSAYAFQLVFDAYRNRIYTVALSYLKEVPLAEEAVQEVFLKLWLQRRELVDIQSLQAWLFTVARNHLLNQLAKIAREHKAKQSWATQNKATEDTASHKLLTAEYDHLLHRAISQLSQRQQQVYRLAKEQGLTYEQIATQLSMSPFTVKTHLSRAMESIRHFLKQHGELFLVLLILREKFF